MKRNYLKKFIKYRKKVYQIEELIKQLEDTRTVRNKKTNYFHSAAFMSTIGSGPRLVIDFELYK